MKQDGGTSSAKPMTITICMGSSCYSRGNGRNIEAIRGYLARRDVKVELVGHLCQEQCSQGPNIAIDGKVYHAVDAAMVVALIDAGRES